MSASSDENRPAVVILGASGGVGAEVAHEAIRRRWNVLLASRPSEHFSRLASEMNVPCFDLDATNLEQVETCLSEAEQKFGRVDGVVNCVGSVILKPAHLTSEADWNSTIAVNLTSAFAVVRAAAKVMKRGGSVVLISSAAARLGLANHEAIAAAKAGIIGLAKSAAATYASRGLRFNVVAPGLVKTKLTEKIWSNERAANASQSMHALGRLGEPQEIANAITWLLDPSNSWITGEVISVDGGLSTVRLQGRPSA
jgi:NAD(P)-dependent dehydrogenase (short-subunit alcohol dehydrogenase family)